MQKLPRKFYARDTITVAKELLGKYLVRVINGVEYIGLDQPKISALNRGRLSGFSIERLFRLLAILNQDIEIVIKPHHGRKNHSIPHIHVRYAT